MRADVRSVQQHLTMIAVTRALGRMTRCRAATPPRQEVGVRKSGEGAVIEGTATDRARIARPPNAVFAALLQDVTGADASAMAMARTALPRPSGPPSRVSSACAPASIDAHRRSAVSARLLGEGKLTCVSATVSCVLTGGAGPPVDSVLKMVGRDVQGGPRSGGAVEPPSMIGAPGLRRPSTCRGDWPCAAGEAMRYPGTAGPIRPSTAGGSGLGRIGCGPLSAGGGPIPRVWT
jgi:uncharacterized lipoprotein YbaY